MSVRRETLYKEVWADPMIEVASRYGVSSNYLTRVCRYLNIPWPPKGYWARLKDGSASAIPPLPAVGPDDESEWIRRSSSDRSNQLIKGTHPQEWKDRDEWPFLHPIMHGVREHFEKTKETSEGYLMPYKRLVPDVFCTKRTLDTALSLANDLYRELEGRGHQVVIAAHRKGLSRRFGESHPYFKHGRHLLHEWSPLRPTVVCVRRTVIGLFIFELMEKCKVQWYKGNYVRVDEIPISHRREYWEPMAREDMFLPSGKLAIGIYSPHSDTAWERTLTDSKGVNLHDKLRTITSAVERAVPVITKLVSEAQQRAEVARQKHIAEHNEWVREERIRCQRLAEKESHEELLSIIERWDKARRIESFFGSIEAEVVRLPPEERAELEERLKRARAYIECTNALQWLRDWKLPEERRVW